MYGEFLSESPGPTLQNRIPSRGGSVRTVPLCAAGLAEERSSKARVGARPPNLARRRLTLMGLAALGFAPALKAGKKAAPPPKKPVNLVWPLPPQKPRIKYVTSLANNTDVEPPKQKGWLQKLINEDATPNVIGMQQPSGIAVDSKDRIYVADTLGGAVFVFDLQSKSLSLLGNDTNGKLVAPFGIAIDSRDNVYVSDVKLKQVSVYDPDWNIQGMVHMVGGQELRNPVGLALDESRRRLFIVDSQTHRVVVSDLDHLDRGTYFGKRGEDEGDFNFPVYATADKSGKVYVTSTLGFSVKVFDSDFKFVKTLGRHGNAVGMFDRPKGVALDSEGHLYVVDASFSNFQIFNPDGHLLLFIGSFGKDPGHFLVPSAIFIDKKDRIYVSDGANKRIQIFQFLGGR
jgi:DNA-binding beta-propeller fold protein YncE